MAYVRTVINSRAGRPIQQKHGIVVRLARKMAGSNLVLKDGQVLFKEGQDADGMYLIRKGGLKVYLEKNGNEVKLANIGAGGMIGEMAFFDKKPRSASVKAAGNTEVTKITPDDFGKLMRQIPKWFVSIMTSLSTRLRETNDRLQRVENQAAGMKGPFEDLIKILHVLILIWHKDGQKEGKYWCLDRKIAAKQIKDIFSMEDNWVKEFIDTLLKLKFFTVTADNYKNELLTIPNKAVLSKLANFIKEFTTTFPEQHCLPKEGVEILESVASLAKDSAYDSANIDFEEAVIEGERLGFKTATWKAALGFFKNNHDAITMIKVSNGMGFKVNKIEIPKHLEQHKILAALAESGLK